MNFKNGEDIVTGVVSVDTKLELTSPYNGSDNRLSLPHGNVEVLLAKIEITNSAGTGIQFSSGEAVGATARKYVTGDKLLIQFIPTVQDLHFKSDNALDSFTITY